jgi:hypothetical protein
MRIVIAGAPGVGKNELAVELQSELKKRGHSLPIAGSSNDYMATFGKAVGVLADYRVEMSLAVRRAFMMDQPAIFEGSLLDSGAHAAAKYKILFDQKAGSEEELYTWWLTLQIISCMIRDTFSSDYLIYITPTDELEGYVDYIDEALFYFLGESGNVFVGIPQSDLQSENRTAIIEGIVNDIIDGQQSEKPITESINGEDSEPGL